MSEKDSILRSYKRHRVHSKKGETKPLKKIKVMADLPMDFVKSGKMNGTIKTGIKGRQAVVERVSFLDNPDSFLATMNNFLTEKECVEILQVLKRDKQVLKLSDDLNHAKMGEVTSKKMEFGDQNRIFKKLRKLVLPLLGVPKGRFDLMRSVLKHYSSKESSEVGIVSHKDSSPFTVLITINNVPKSNGGGTKFNVNSDDSIVFQPVKGRAYWFRNISTAKFKTYNPVLFRIVEEDFDEVLRHEGMALTRGTKTIVQFLTHGNM